MKELLSDRRFYLVLLASAATGAALGWVIKKQTKRIKKRPRKKYSHDKPRVKKHSSRNKDVPPLRKESKEKVSTDSNMGNKQDKPASSSLVVDKKEPESPVRAATSPAIVPEVASPHQEAVSGAEFAKSPAQAPEPLRAAPLLELNVEEKKPASSPVKAPEPLRAAPLVELQIEDKKPAPESSPVKAPEPLRAAPLVELNLEEKKPEEAPVKAPEPIREAPLEISAIPGPLPATERASTPPAAPEPARLVPESEVVKAVPEVSETPRAAAAESPRAVPEGAPVESPKSAAPDLVPVPLEAIPKTYAEVAEAAKNLPEAPKVAAQEVPAAPESPKAAPEPVVLAVAEPPTTPTKKEGDLPIPAEATSTPRKDLQTAPGFDSINVPDAKEPTCVDTASTQTYASVLKSAPSTSSQDETLKTVGDATLTGSTTTSTSTVLDTSTGSTASSSGSSDTGTKVTKKESRTTCDCRVHRDEDKLPGDDEIDLPNGIAFEPIKTQIFPILYERHKPPDLVDDMDEPKDTKVCDNALKRLSPREKESIITAFRPVLNSLVYAHKHAHVISDLVDNYAFLD